MLTCFKKLFDGKDVFTGDVWNQYCDEIDARAKVDAVPWAPDMWKARVGEPKTAVNEEESVTVIKT